jgi:6-pyruvoyl-tetrahydropterin synthase
VLNQPGANEHGMVIDFGTIKSLMMDILDAVFDHAFVVSKYDTALMEMYFPSEEPDAVYSRFSGDFRGQLSDYCAALRGGSETKAIELPRTCFSEQDPDGMKIVPVDYSPTAENMARNMFDLMREALHNYYRNDEIRIMNIRLYETPNGYVDYPGKVFARDMPDWDG